MFDKTFPLRALLAASALALSGTAAQAACLDNVVMVHGSTASPSTWNATVLALKSRGYVDSQLYRPSWGTSSIFENDHRDAHVAPIRNALQAAKAASCTGKVDVIAHSMGVTIAMKAINDLNYSANVNSFIGIAGGQHGFNSCGIYPFNLPTKQCGALGLSRNSPLINSVKGKRYGAKMYSIKSYVDEIVCAGPGGCFVNGSHTSNIDMQNATYDYAMGHLTIQVATPNTQAELVFK